MTNEEMVSNLLTIDLPTADQTWLEWKENYEPDLNDEERTRLIKLYEEHFGYGRE